MLPSDIENRFADHPASRSEKADEHTAARQGCRELAFLLDELMPDGREKSLAITHLEDVMHWANAGIARNTAP